MNQIRLLMVDDEALFLSPLVKRLTKRGFEPETANDGSSCLNMMRQKQYDILVLDVKMPGMSGLDVLSHVKTHYPETEIILLTGHASVQDGIEGIKSGAFDYLSKPVELEHLIGKICQAYEKIERIKEKKAEAIFKEKIQKEMSAAERLASVGTLAVGVAHEINNPLAIINEAAGWLKLLLNRNELKQMPFQTEFKMALDKIENGVERASKITHQLLGFVRDDNEVIREINPIKFMNETIQFVHREAANKQIEIDCENHVTIPVFWSDPFQLRQVLINLLINAIQATPPQGRIQTRIDNTKKEILFTVNDTGIGIPEENLEKIFEPFFSTKAQGEGTGLGLFISRGIIDKLGGMITIESKPGIGTTFVVVLPITNKK